MIQLENIANFCWNPHMHLHYFFIASNDEDQYGLQHVLLESKTFTQTAEASFFALLPWSVFFSVAGKVSNQNMGILVHKHPQYSLPLETPFSNLPFFDFPKYIFWTGHMDQVAVWCQFEENLFCTPQTISFLNSKKYLSYKCAESTLNTCRCRM